MLLLLFRIHEISYFRLHISYESFLVPDQLPDFVQAFPFGFLAVALARQKRYAVILMDMQMPNLNGVDAAKAIRADSLNRDTPILAMTANAFPEDRQTCFAVGMNDFITKPVDPDNIYATLLKWLSGSGGDETGRQ